MSSALYDPHSLSRAGLQTPGKITTTNRQGRLLVVIFPEETIPSWNRGGTPHPATALMRRTLIAERKENIYGPPFLKTPRAPRMPRRPWGG